jgi:Tol biopolymer transport system component
VLLSTRFLLSALGAVLLAAAATGCGSGHAQPEILFLSDRDGDWALYAMGTDGRKEQRVSRAGAADPFGFGLGLGEPLVSPDGRSVLVARNGLTVEMLATGTSKAIARGEEGDAAWSPDSNEVVFSGPQAEGLYVVNVRNGRRRTLLATSYVSTPAWSPDGKWIAFSRQDEDGGPDVVDVMHPDGRGLTFLTQLAPDENGFSWSRGSKLAFFATRASADLEHLVVVDVRTHRTKVIQGSFGGGRVAWSPDGGRLAFSATAPHTGASSIDVVNADGSARRRLTPARSPYDYDSPAWSSDGKSLLFVRTPDRGGGVDRGIGQVWTMRADGSHERPLTAPFPDDGANLEPAWVSGPIHREPAPRTAEIRGRGRVVLRLPFPVNGVSAEGSRVAIAPASHPGQGEEAPTPPILVWRPSRAEPTRLVASGCAGVENVVLSGSRLAFDCDHSYLDFVYQSLWVYDLRTRLPREVFFGHADNFRGGVYLGQIAGGHGLLAFSSERANGSGIARQRALWRIDRFDSVALRSHSGDLLAAGGGRLAVKRADGRVALTTRGGRVVRVLTLPRPPTFSAKPPYLLAGRNLLVVDRRSFADAYDTETGRLLWRRRVAGGAELESTDGRLVVYTAGASIHLLSGGRDRVLRTGAQRLPRLRGDVDRPVYAALTPAGLFYCFNVADRAHPGRVVFVSRDALPR